MGTPLAGAIMKFCLPDNVVFTFYALPLFFFPLSTAGAGISAGLFLLIYAASGHWQRWREVTQRPWSMPLALLIALTFIGLLWTKDLHAGFKVAAATGYGIYAFMGATLPWRQQWVRWLIRLFLAGLFLNAVAAFLMTWHILPWHNENYIAYTGFADHIWLSMALTHALLWILWDLRIKWNFNIWTNITLAFLFFSQLAITPGRSGQLLFVLLMPLAVWFLFKGKWRYWALVAITLTVACMALSPIVQSRVSLGIQNLEQFIANPDTTTTSWGERLATMWAGIDMAYEHPIDGVGTGDFAPAMRDLQSRHLITETPGTIGDSAANSYISEAAILGLPGLLLLLLFLISLSKETWNARMTPQGWFVLSYLGIFWIGGFYNTLTWGYADAFTIAILAGLPLTTKMARYTIGMEI